MRVQATAPGYYDLKRRKEGDEFTIKSEKEFSDKWMEPVDKQDVKNGQPILKKTKVVDLKDAV